MTSKPTVDFRDDFIDAAMGQLDAAMGQASVAGERIMSLHNGNLAFATDLTKLGLAYGEQVARRLQAMGRTQIEQANAAFKSATVAPTPAEIIALQLDFVRSLSNGFAAEMTQASEAAMQHSGAVLETISRHFGELARDTSPAPSAAAATRD